MQVFLSIYTILNFRAPKLIASDECIILRDIFGNASAKFTLCAVENSRPLKVCQNCIDSYKNVVESYGNMSKVFFLF